MDGTMKRNLSTDLMRYADMVEGGELISPDEMNCAAVMRLAAEALAKQEQGEPVAFKPPAKWRDDEIANGCRGIRWVAADGVYGRPTQEDVEQYLGYTTPQQRTWVGLTNEEIATTADYFKDSYGFTQGVLWAEAKLKEKNR